MLRCRRVWRWKRPCYPQRPRTSQRTQSIHKHHKGKTKLSQLCLCFIGWSWCFFSHSFDWFYLLGHNKAKCLVGWWWEKLQRRGRTRAPVSSTRPKQKFRNQPHTLSWTIEELSQQNRQADRGSSLSPDRQVTASLNEKSSCYSTSFLKTLLL